MNRFILFAGECFYPGGGWCDYAGSFEVVAEAEKAGGDLIAVSRLDVEDWTQTNVPPWMTAEKANSGPYSFDWWHVIDTETWSVVASHKGDLDNGWPL